MARLSMLAALALAAGCSTPIFQGKVVDGITGEPVGGFDMVLKLREGESASLPCMTKGGPVAEDGTFKVELCANSYDVTFTDEELWAAEFAGVDAGMDLTQPIEIKVWHAPAGSGLYLYKDHALETLKSGSDIKFERALNDREQIIYYPEGLKNITAVNGDAKLVITGPNNVDNSHFLPLIKSTGPRKFAGKTEQHNPNVYPEPWWFVGVEFTTDTEWARKDAEPDPAKVVKKQQGDRVALIIDADALPTGRYVFLAKDKPKRAYVVDWGGYEEPK